MVGRNQNSEIDRLRPKCWYWYIKSLTDLSDAKLDILFAEDESGRKYTNADRPRIFESIRKNGTTPSNGNHRLRKFSLIDKVDAHTSFGGSKNLFMSPFWDLLQLRPMDLDENNKILETCFKRLNLTRLDYGHQYFWDYMDVPSDPSDRQGISPHYISDFEHTFHKAISYIPDSLDLLALIGALYRESCLTFQLENAIVLSRYFQMVSDACLNTEWHNPVGVLIWEIAHERIINGNYKYETSMRDKNNIYKNMPKSFGVIVNKLDQRCIDRFESNP